MVWVGFRYTLCPRETSVFLYLSIYLSTSRNGKWPSSSISMVNFILLCNPFRWSKNSVSLSRPWGQMAKVSSTYLYQHVSLCVACSNALFSKCSMKKFATTDSLVIANFGGWVWRGKLYLPLHTHPPTLNRPLPDASLPHWSGQLQLEPR